MSIAALQPLPYDDRPVMIVPMLTTSHAVDLFLGDLQRRSRSQSGRTSYSYRLLLEKFAGSLGELHMDVTEISPDHCRRFLDRYVGAPGYQSTIHATLNSFLEWLHQQQRIRRNPLDHVRSPRRQRPEDLAVTAVSTEDVPRLLAAAVTHTEKLAIAIPAYLGPRRHATALLRLSDFDQERGQITFREKGHKTISKPVPAELVRFIQAAIDDGKIVEPTDYIVPPEGPLVKSGDRCDRIIWRVVKRVAARAGVNAHVHALRGAFAVFYLQEHPNDLVGLQELLGHSSSETTKVYLRKMNKQAAMEPVRTLSWGAVAADNGVDLQIPQTAGIRLYDSPVVGAGGFEPPLGDTPHEHRGISTPSGAEPLPDLNDALRTSLRLVVRDGERVDV